MKSKFAFGLLVVMIVLALAPSSFAQINIQIFNQPSPQEIKTNRTAETSDPTSAGSGITVSGSLIANSALTSTDLILTFPAPITVAPQPAIQGGGFNVPAGDPIRIVAASGVFANAQIRTVSGSTITIQLIPTDEPNNQQSGSFRVISTRIDANALAGNGPFNATASLSNSANNFLLSTTSFAVISALGDGIGSVAQGICTSATRCGNNNGPLVIFTNKNVAQATTQLTITEGFNFAWRSGAENERNATGGAAGVGPTKIRVTLSGIPSNTTVSLGSINTNSGSVSGVVAVTGGTTASLTSSNNTVVLAITGSRNDAIDQIQLNLTASAPTSNPSLGTITATATMFPIGPAFGDATTGQGGLNGGFLTQVTDETGTSNVVVPRFAAAEVGPATIGNVVAATTTMLLPFAQKVGAFDTGIAISNTTVDPFGATGGGATATAGTITLDFFPRNATGTGAGTAFSLTTSSTVKPGGGLSADGTLAGGATWTVLLTELMTAAGQTGDFVGYIFIRTNFLLAHGAATVSDFKTFSLASPVLVLPNPANTSRATLGIENLSQ